MHNTSLHIEPSNGIPLVEANKNDFTGIIRQIIDNLKALNSSTEHDFLSIGASMNDIYERASNISKTANLAVELTAENNSTERTDDFNFVFDTLKEHLERSQDKISTSTSILKKMLDICKTSKTPTETFKKIVKHLRVLSVSTKIENARLGTNDNSFDILAEDIEKLSVIIGSKTVNLFNGLSALDDKIHQTLSRTYSYKDAKYDITNTALNAITEDLKILSEKNSKSFGVIKRLETQSTAISGDISDIVSSLQFHDITRQQIEHVVDIFDDICSTEETEKGNGNSCVYAIREIGELQVRQLNNAKKEFISAVENIINSLTSLSGSVLKMSDEVTRLISAAGSDNSSFISELCNSLSNISAFLEKNRELDGWLSDAMHSVSETIADISVFVNDIEDIGLEIELIALNAQIKAAHAGEKGSALSVLAEAIRTLSHSARHQTSVVTAGLKNMNDAAHELDNQSVIKNNIKSDKTRDASNIIERLGASLGETHENLHMLLKNLEDETRGLLDSIAFITGNINAHTKTGEVIDEVNAGLKELIEYAKETASKNEDNNGNGCKTDYIKQLVEKYTMHSERQIHKTYFNQNTKDKNHIPTKDIHVPMVNITNENTDGFGDNVELF